MGAQFLVIALPGFGHFEEFGEAADLISVHGDPDPIARPFDVEAPQFPGEGMIGAVGAFDRSSLDEFQRGNRPLEGADDKFFGQIAGFDFAQLSPFLLLFELVLEADQFAAGGNFNAEFLFLEFARPAMAPAPEAHGIADNGGGAFETEFALEKSFGLVIVAEDSAVAVGIHLQAALL